MENIPEDGAVLLVGNHSGGNLIIDTFAFTLAFETRSGVERPFYQLAHNLVLLGQLMPWVPRSPQPVSHQELLDGAVERLGTFRLRHVPAVEHQLARLH